MAASASRGGDASPSSAQQKVDSKVLWHFGLMPTEGRASSGGEVARVLHVDARGDRLVEIVDARISRVIPLDDLVSYEEEEDEDEDEDAFFVDEDEAATRSRERATVSLCVRRRPFEEVEDIKYRLQSLPDARALRAVLARLSRGRAEDEDAESSADAVPGLDARLLRAGTLMRRVGRVALSDAETAAGRGGGRWTTCVALCVPGKLILLAKRPSDPERFDERPGDDDGDKKNDSHRAPAPAVATGGRASPLAIHFAASLADARVISRAPRWNAGGGGEFDLVFGGGRLVLAAPRGGRHERDAWTTALERAALGGARLGGAAKPRGAETPSRGRENVSASDVPMSSALTAATRAAVAEARRVADATCLDFGDARSVFDDDVEGDAETSAAARGDRERVSVPDAFRRSPARGVGAHFLFNFTAEVLPDSRNATRAGADEAARPRRRLARARVLLHVDVERNAVEAYADPRARGSVRSVGSIGAAKSRAAVLRSVETKDVRLESSGPREVTLRAAGHGSFPRRAVLGRFAFQTAADHRAFASLVRDLRDGAYRSADRYQYRAPLKRGAETGVSKEEAVKAPARFLVLVPGKLLVLRGDRAGVPLATASLAEGAEVTVLEKTTRGAETDRRSASSVGFASAVVALRLPNGDAFAFRFATLQGAKSWARALAEAAVAPVEPVAEDANGNDSREAEGAARADASTGREKAESESDSGAVASAKAAEARAETEELERLALETRVREKVHERLEAERALEAEKARRALEAERQTKEASRARVDALAAEIAAAVMSGADPFAATRANSVASPGSARDSPYAPRAAAPRLDAYAARDGWPREGPDARYAHEAHERLSGDDPTSAESAESSPSVSPCRTPPSPPGRMQNAFFALGTRSEPAGRSRSESPPAVEPRFAPAASGAARRLLVSSRAAGAGVGAAVAGADVGVGPAAETTGRASVSSSSSDASTSSRSSSPGAPEARPTLAGVSLPRRETEFPAERAAPRDAERPEPPPSALDLAFLVGAALGEAREREGEAAGAQPEAASAASAPPAAAPGMPDWSRLVEENLERGGAETESASAAAAPPTEVSEPAPRAPRRADFEPSSFGDTPPAPGARAATSRARGDGSASSLSAAPPTHFLAVAAARSRATDKVAPASPKRKPPQHPRAAPSLPPAPPAPAPGPVNTKKKSMIKSMFKGLFSSSSGEGKKKRDEDEK